jgi:hypothetical protein
MLRFKLSIRIIEVAFDEARNDSLEVYPFGSDEAAAQSEGAGLPPGSDFKRPARWQDVLPRLGGRPRGETCQLPRMLDHSRGGYFLAVRE